MKRVVYSIALAVCVLAPAYSQQLMEMCTSDQSNTPDKTCVVDGDTIWFEGENIRLEGFDTPEPQTAICGGDREKALAGEASARLRELLNTNTWTLARSGSDRFGRTLATIRIDGIDVGQYLVEERLARWWPDGEEWWCD